ncbi:MAG: ABC transporter ATP-binding protein/permease [Planctomycetes bacterium]|nr:ABC transporter ATP-binding protein/permease [Planctomycetota bacterium]
MNYLWRSLVYLRPYWRSVVVMMMLVVLDSALSLLTPWPFKYLIDYSLSDNPAPEWLVGWLGQENFRWRLLYACAATEVAIIFLYQIIGVIESYVTTRLEQNIDRDFRSRLFAHAMDLSLAYHDHRRSGMLIYVITTQGGAVADLLMSLPSVIQSAVMLVGMLIVLFRMHWSLAAVSLVVVPALFFASKWYATRMRSRIRETKELEGEALSVIHEAMSMMRVIVAFCRQKLEHRRYINATQRAMDARVGVTLRQTLFSLAIHMSTGVGRAAAWTVGGLLALAGKLTVGDLTIVLSYIDKVYDPLETIAYTYSGWQDQFASLRASFGLLDTKPDIAEPASPVQVEPCRGRVEFRKVDFAYEGRTDTLKDVSFVAEPGQVTAVVGPTGAGKTTLISLIPRFYDAAGGGVFVDGVNVKDLGLDDLRRHISVVLQEPLLFSMSIRDNLRYGRLDATEEEIVEAARAANAHDFISRLPEGYDTVLGERGSRLSGGERQRICVARAFLKDAPILILDEPTSSIDSKTEAVILDSLDRLMEGRTTFMIAHRLSTIRRADWILVMDQGRVVEQGKHDDLLAAGRLYRQLHDLQTKLAERKAASRAIWSST